MCLTIPSMLHNDPKLRSTAEAALMSPFFSIPFGLYHSASNDCLHCPVCAVTLYEELLWVSAPHIEDLVLLPTPVLRLLNVIDDSHLYNEDEYEGQSVALHCFRS